MMRASSLLMSLLKVLVVAVCDDILESYPAIHTENRAA
jgi:hypothetical protein